MNALTHCTRVHRREFLLASLAVLLGACGVSPRTPTPTSTPPTARTQVVLLDDTGSMEPVFEPMLATIANALESLAGAGMPATTLYIHRLTGGGSYADDRSIISLALPALPLPVAPLRAAPPNTGTAARATQVARHSSDVDRVDAAVRGARAELVAAATRVRRLPLTRQSGTDVVGAIARAADRLVSVPGERRLLVCSDLQPSGPQGKAANLSLPGVLVTVAFLACRDGKACADTRARWGDAFRVAGAAGIRFLDVEQSKLAGRRLLAE